MKKWFWYPDGFNERQFWKQTLEVFISIISRLAGKQVATRLLRGPKSQSRVDRVDNYLVSVREWKLRRLIATVCITSCGTNEMDYVTYLLGIWEKDNEEINRNRHLLLVRDVIGSRNRHIAQQKKCTDTTKANHRPRQTDKQRLYTRHLLKEESDNFTAAAIRIIQLYRKTGMEKRVTR